MQPLCAVKPGRRCQPHPLKVANVALDQSGPIEGDHLRVKVIVAPRQIGSLLQYFQALLMPVEASDMAAGVSQSANFQSDIPLTLSYS